MEAVGLPLIATTAFYLPSRLAPVDSARIIKSDLTLYSEVYLRCLEIAERWEDRWYRLLALPTLLRLC